LITRVVVSAICITLTLQPASALAQERRPLVVPRQIVEQLIKDTALAAFVQRRADGTAANLIAEPVDLNRDGIRAFEVHGIGSICGANNCVTWIYRRTGSGYERLLAAGSIQTVEPQPTVSSGYRDVMTTKHGSAWDADLTLYKFDGRAYRRTGCFFRTYHCLDRHGQMRELKRPRITPVTCEPDDHDGA
jgi:hypothetical protein